MLKNLALAAWSLSLMLVVACSSDVDVAGGGTIDPNANNNTGVVNGSEMSSSSDASINLSNNPGIIVGSFVSKYFCITQHPCLCVHNSDEFSIIIAFILKP